nr:hypothetical protein [Candidatus Sigynarchaeum springense]
MAARLTSKQASATRLHAAVVSYSTRQPRQSGSAARTLDTTSSISSAARPRFPAAYLVPPFPAAPGFFADYRRNLLATKPSRRSLNARIVKTASLRVGSREVSDLQYYRFFCLYRGLATIKFIYQCRHQ